MKKYKNIFLVSTDTVPGLATPISYENKKMLYALKGRPEEKPFIIGVANLEQARKFRGWNEKAEELAKEVWPGNTTLALSESIALRIPDQKGLLEWILEKGPVYLTSANIAGKAPESFEVAKKQFSNIGGAHNFGEGSGKPSKIINVNDGEILRD
ncbi:MAG: Sua5/YciO/YrdC/YwlC family protein [Mycoplasmataceae bacterium]|nr:Sua5/YciO/YrdC/YwlC family protein [Mycoplasmataceae bacterium]